MGTVTAVTDGLLLTLLTPRWKGSVQCTYPSHQHKIQQRTNMELYNLMFTMLNLKATQPVILENDIISKFNRKQQRWLKDCNILCATVWWFFIFFGQEDDSTVCANKYEAAVDSAIASWWCGKTQKISQNSVESTLWHEWTKTVRRHISGNLAPFTQNSEHKVQF